MGAIQRFGAIALILLVGTAVAQQVPRPGDTVRGLQILPDTDREQTPAFLPETPSPDFRLPPLQRPADSDRLAAGISIRVSDINVVGNSVLGEEMEKLVEPYRNTLVTSADLQQLRHALSRLYIDNGYVNSGVTLPDQTVADGIVIYEVIEGRLSDVVVRGNGRLQNRYVQRRIARVLQQPLRVDELRDRLVMLQQDPLIGSLRSELRPGSRRGDSILEVDFDAARAWELTLGVANDRAPSVGGESTTLGFYHGNGLGFGDALSLRAGSAEGLEDYSMSYSIPVAPRGARLGFSARKSNSDVVEAPFNEIDIASRSTDLALHFSYPISHSLQRSLMLNFDLEKRRSTTFLLGRTFSFSPGVTDGRSRVTALRSGAEWIRRARNDVIALRGTLSAGFDAWNPTKNGGQPDSEFLALLTRAQWAHRFAGNDWQLVVSGDFQFADDGLLPLEKFAIGGANTVRGYRENQFVRDRGWVASAELRVPVFGGTGQVYYFTDHGRAWNASGAAPSASIGGLGVGLRYNGAGGFSADIAAAMALRNLPDSGDLQDDGIHFRFSYSTP